MSGSIGICVSCISYNENYKIAITADEGVCPNTKLLVDSIQDNIESEIERMKDVPLPSSAAAPDSSPNTSPNKKEN